VRPTVQPFGHRSFGARDAGGRFGDAVVGERSSLLHSGESVLHIEEWSEGTDGAVIAPG
jgi:hypothetical protein